MSIARTGCMEEASHTGFYLNLGMRDWHGHDGGREACGSWEWWFSVHMLLWLSNASFRIFENMHKDQLEEMVTLEGCSPLGFQGKSESLPE